MFLLRSNVLRLTYKALLAAECPACLTGLSIVETRIRYTVRNALFANRASSLCLSLVSGDLPDIAERIPDHSAPVAVEEVPWFFERHRARI
jgi:hypothetical protein